MDEEEEEESTAKDDAFWAARTGDLDDLKVASSRMKGNVNCIDPSTGSTLLHMAAANGHVDCVSFLLEQGADQTIVNSSKSSPLHWAVQNNQVEVCRALCQQPQANVLLQNGLGKGSTTLAFEKGHTDLVKILLEHPSASPLEPKEDQGEDQEDGTNVNDDKQTHDLSFSFIKSTDDPNPLFIIREVGFRPKTLEELAEGDINRTHFTVWAASVILARWAIQEIKPGCRILELGAGCGLPGIAAHRCCKPKSVLLTDLEIHDHILFNIRTARKRMAKTAKGKMELPPITSQSLDWTDTSSFPQEWVGETDVLLGSDLVYDKTLVEPLVNCCAELAKPKTGIFLYVTAMSDRAGMEDFLRAMDKHFVLEKTLSPLEDQLKSPLSEDKQELFEMHLSELRDVDHKMYKFRRL